MQPTLNLNQSDRDVLAADPAIGKARAQAIIHARPFANWSDLERAGVDDALVQRLKDGGAELGAPSFARMGPSAQEVRPVSGDAAARRLRP